MKRFSVNPKIFFIVVFGMLLASCSKSSDYQCTIQAGQVVTNPDGTQYTVSDTETKPCSDCSTKDVDKLESQGYACNK